MFNARWSCANCHGDVCIKSWHQRAVGHTLELLETVRNHDETLSFPGSISYNAKRAIYVAVINFFHHLLYEIFKPRYLQLMRLISFLFDWCHSFNIYFFLNLPRRFKNTVSSDWMWSIGSEKVTMHHVFGRIWLISKHIWLLWYLFIFIFIHIYINSIQLLGQFLFYVRTM